MRSVLTASVVCAAAAVFSTGCVYHEYRERPRVVETETVVEGPGVEVVEVEPPPVERVYVYEEGYPPGTYIYGGRYYYGGRRYERDVFVNRVVNVNVHENRYVNVTENRREVDRVKVVHQEEFQRTGGRRNVETNGNVPQHQATDRQPVTHTQTQRPVLVPGVQPAPPPPQKPKPKPKPNPNNPYGA